MTPPDTVEGRELLFLPSGRAWLGVERRRGAPAYLRLVLGRVEPDGRRGPVFFATAMSINRGRALLDKLKRLIEAPGPIQTEIPTGEEAGP